VCLDLSCPIKLFKFTLGVVPSFHSFYRLASWKTTLNLSLSSVDYQGFGDGTGSYFCF
jgi:hypothetical protein